MGTSQGNLDGESLSGCTAWGMGSRDTARKIQAPVGVLDTLSCMQGPLATAASGLLPFSFSKAGDTPVSTGP